MAVSALDTCYSNSGGLQYVPCGLIFLCVRDTQVAMIAAKVLHSPSMLNVLLALALSFGGPTLQDDDNWPPLSYLRSDYKSVAVVAHIRIEHAEITNRVGGYENWKINAVVLESFKGKFKKGDTIEYFHGAEAGFKKEYFTGEKIIFLLAESDRERKHYYAVLENSTLPYTKDRINKLRLIKKSYLPKRKRK